MNMDCKENGMNMDCKENGMNPYSIFFTIHIHSIFPYNPYLFHFSLHTQPLQKTGL